MLIKLYLFLFNWVDEFENNYLDKRAKLVQEEFNEEKVFAMTLGFALLYIFFIAWVRFPVDVKNLYKYTLEDFKEWWRCMTL